MIPSGHREIVLPTARPLKNWELEVLGRLLSRPFVGRETAVAQVAQAHVVAECLDCPFAELEVPGVVPLLADAGGNLLTADLPCELRGRDLDGMAVQVVIHVVEGRVFSIEANRGDFEPWRSLPDPAGLDLFCRE